MRSEETKAAKSLFIVASAGSGKTTHLVSEALKISDKNVLITTYTEANNEEIKNKIIEQNRATPKNLFAQTWFSMLLQYGVRPYQGHFLDKDVSGMILAKGQSAPRTKETDLKHYFTNDFKIYSDKISKFVIKCNKESSGKVISRLARIFSHIFIDEAQDLAGYDLDLIRLMCESDIKIILVGDPRQGTFSTNNSTKNRKYRRSEILNYFYDNMENEIDVQDTLLAVNHRSIQNICSLADKLFPDFPQATSGNNNQKDHSGVFLVKPNEVEKYISTYQPTILRYNKTTRVASNAKVMNFGNAKGLAFDRVLIYPTGPINKWLKDRSSDLADTSRAKLYVAITRARFSVAFVYDYKDSETIEDCEKYGDET